MMGHDPHSASPPAPPPSGTGLLHGALAAASAFLLALTLLLAFSADIRRAAAAIPENPSAGLDPFLEDVLRAELESLKGRYNATMAGCAPEDDPEPVIEELPPELPEPVSQTFSPSAGSAPVALEAIAPPLPPPPPPPPAPKAKPKPKPKKRPKPKLRPQPVPKPQNDCGCG
jgi:hypothetical protein